MIKCLPIIVYRMMSIWFCHLKVQIFNVHFLKCHVFASSLTLTIIFQLKSNEIQPERSENIQEMASKAVINVCIIKIFNFKHILKSSKLIWWQLNFFTILKPKSFTSSSLKVFEPELPLTKTSVSSFTVHPWIIFHFFFHRQSAVVVYVLCSFSLTFLCWLPICFRMCFLFPFK